MQSGKLNFKHDIRINPTPMELSKLSSKTGYNSRTPMGFFSSSSVIINESVAILLLTRH